MRGKFNLITYSGFCCHALPYNIIPIWTTAGCTGLKGTSNHVADRSSVYGFADYSASLSTGPTKLTNT